MNVAETTDITQHLRSDLPVHLYHQYADATMDTMLESLENLLDEVGDPDSEVEYSVSVGRLSTRAGYADWRNVVERGPDIEIGQ